MRLLVAAVAVFGMRAPAAAFELAEIKCSGEHQHEDAAQADVTKSKLIHRRSEDSCVGDYDATDAIADGPRKANCDGSTGNGCMDYQGGRDSLTWVTTACQAGSYIAAFRYTLESGSRPLRVTVNGVDVVASQSFPATGGWSKWGTVGIPVTLGAGTNTIALTGTGSSGGNFDKMTLTGSRWGAGVCYEATDQGSSTDAEAAAKKASVQAALSNLAKHVAGTASLSAAKLEENGDAVLLAGMEEIKLHVDLAEQTLDLIDAFEQSAKGPLFMTASTRKGFPETGAAHALERTMWKLQQAFMDEIVNRLLIVSCSPDTVRGRGWKTAAFFPGAAAPPADPTVEHAVTINAVVPRMWGLKVMFADMDVTRPTGFYLSPGQIATVTVPQSVVDSGGWSVKVGASTNDMANKGGYIRLDRVSVSYPVGDATEVTIYNPLGGGVYMEVPVGTDLGARLQITIRGGVVPAPFFRDDRVGTTSASEWEAELAVNPHARTAPAPWAEFETKYHLMQVPSTWIAAKSGAQVAKLMADYDKAHIATYKMFGHPIETSHRHILYLQPDLRIKHGAYGTGYPQINTVATVDSDGDGANPRFRANPNHWMVTTGLWATCYHEQGHAQLFSKYAGETEAAVNFPHVYIRNTQFGVDLDVAFSESMTHANKSPDQAAVDWMVTATFRSNKEMVNSGSPTNEFRYQERGYVKYADIARLYGWDAFTNFYLAQNEEYMAGVAAGTVAATYSGNDWPKGGEGLSKDDYRTLRWGDAAKYDLTPLLHFYGIHPDNPTLLKEKTAEHGLKPSPALKELLQKYKRLAPANNAEFSDYFDAIHPGMPVKTVCTASSGYKQPSGCKDPRYGVGWFNVWRDAYTEAEGTAAKSQVQDIIDLYYPDDPEQPACGDTAATVLCAGDGFEAIAGYADHECTDLDAKSECRQSECCTAVPACAICVAQVPECSPSCKSCVVTEATCDACSVATCNDSCGESSCLRSHTRGKRPLLLYAKADTSGKLWSCAGTGETAVLTVSGCKAAASAMGMPFKSQVSPTDGRPSGCFWNKPGVLYFNQNTAGDAVTGWGGVRSVCKVTS